MTGKIARFYIEIPHERIDRTEATLRAMGLDFSSLHNMVCLPQENLLDSIFSGSEGQYAIENINAAMADQEEPGRIHQEFDQMDHSTRWDLLALATLHTSWEKDLNPEVLELEPERVRDFLAKHPNPDGPGGPGDKANPPYQPRQGPGQGPGQEPGQEPDQQTAGFHLNLPISQLDTAQALLAGVGADLDPVDNMMHLPQDNMMYSVFTGLNGQYAADRINNYLEENAYNERITAEFAHMPAETRRDLLGGVELATLHIEWTTG